MEAMSLVEVVLNQGNEDENEKPTSNSPSISNTSPIKGLDESVTITVTRTPSKPVTVHRQSGKPANFALMSPVKNGRNSDAIRLTPREEMVCGCCQRIFKYKAAFLRHEAQCGLPVALKIERAALIEAKKAEKVAEIEKRKVEDKHEKEQKLPELRCPTCLKQFTERESFKSHNFHACAAERATYTFVCTVCKARFKYKNHLRRHEDSHNNVRRHNCDVCTTAFLRPDHLKRHMMRMHGIVQHTTQSSPEEMTGNPSPGLRAASDETKSHTIPKTTPMQCPMCSKILSRRDHVLRHMRNVHHISYEPRKHGRELESFHGLEEPMGQSRNDSYQDDEDGSENQSMASHDGLLIDESFESVKTENQSPNPDDCIESTKNTENVNIIPPSKLYVGTPNYDESIMKKLNHPFNQNNLGVSINSQTQLLGYGMDPTYCNTNGHKNEIHAAVNVNTTEAVCSNSSMGFGHIVRREQPVPEGKISHISSSDGNNSNAPMSYGHLVKREQLVSEGKISHNDGNQNVLSNGHAAQTTGDDWISDLAKYSSW